MWGHMWHRHVVRLTSACSTCCPRQSKEIGIALPFFFLGVQRSGPRGHVRSQDVVKPTADEKDKAKSS